MIDHSEFARFSFENRMNCGIMYACHGTAMVPMYVRNSASRPGNRVFANP